VERGGKAERESEEGVLKEDSLRETKGLGRGEGKVKGDREGERREHYCALLSPIVCDATSLGLAGSVARCNVCGVYEKTKITVTGSSVERAGA
jgi:hypothetical protein